MGTRSDIIIKTKRKGKPVWARIYCHWNGAPKDNGKILAEHYTSQVTVNALVKLGNLSVLGAQADRPNVPKMDHHVDGKYVEGYCLAYGRDRGEEGNEALIFDSLSAAWPEPNCGTEYTYVWDGEQWHVGDPDKGTQSLFTLESVLAGKNTVTSNIKAFGVNFVIGKHTT